VERCSKYTGSEFKDNPVGTAASIQTRTKPSNLEPTKPEKDASEDDIIIWKDDCTDFRRKGRIWTQTNPRIFNMVLGQCTQEMKSKLKGCKGWTKILEDQDGVVLLKEIHRLCN
jgi:hypothetical protein